MDILMINMAMYLFTMGLPRGRKIIIYHSLNQLVILFSLSGASHPYPQPHMP